MDKEKNIPVYEVDSDGETLFAAFQKNTEIGKKLKDSSRQSCPCLSPAQLKLRME